MFGLFFFYLKNKSYALCHHQRVVCVRASIMRAKVRANVSACCEIPRLACVCFCLCSPLEVQVRCSRRERFFFLGLEHPSNRQTVVSLQSFAIFISFVRSQYFARIFGERFRTAHYSSPARVAWQCFAVFFSRTFAPTVCRRKLHQARRHVVLAR